MITLSTAEAELLAMIDGAVAMKPISGSLWRSEKSHQTVWQL